MQRGLANRLRILALCFVLIIPFMNANTLLAGTQGFGVMKKDTHFFRHRSPKIFLEGANVGVRVASSDTLLKRSIEREIRAGDETIRLDPPDPQIIIDCQSSEPTRSESWRKKVEYENQKVGEEEVWNKKKQKLEKKDVYKSAKVEVQYVQVTWKAFITFSIRDTRSNLTLDSSIYPYHWTHEFKKGEVTPGSAPDFRIWSDQVGVKIAGYIVPVKEKVRILLPKGKLDEVSDKIEERKLAEALQKLEDMAPLKNPQDEAYKVYILGACYEAMAYEKARTSSLHEYLELASKNYAKAIEMKPDEEYFLEAQKRLQMSISMYRTLTTQHYAFKKIRSEALQKEFIGQPLVASLKTSSSQPAQSEKAPPPAIVPKPEIRPQPRSASNTELVSESASVINNETIVKMIKAGLSEENIIATINEAKMTNFDLSPNAQVQLIQSGVTNRIISAMRQVRKSN